MSLAKNQIELLSPAKTIEIGQQAIIHGADAVYIGGPSFGARHNASNSVSDIARLVEFAHRYHARIFVTLNTILHDSELEPARKLISEFYDAGVDALIIQDMGILELDIPPIQLHASTQCDIRTLDKAKFLSQVGFSQLVLARELTIPQIRAINDAVETPLEYFVHGALCVAFSGQCYISHAETGRSANRGDCSQACRLPYTLTDSSGGVVAYEKHLLSMKDNDQSRNLEALIDAGVQSLKIEGRYKDMGYVKNITAHYRLLIDEIMTRRPELYRASTGKSEIYFKPDVDKNFNRGHTDYFANGRQEEIGAFDSPKYLGIELGEVTRVDKDSFDLRLNSIDEALANGDGLNTMFKREAIGIKANTVRCIEEARANQGALWRVFPNEMCSNIKGLRVGALIHRNHDQRWEMNLTKESAERRIDLDIEIDEWERVDAQGVVCTGLRLSLVDEAGIQSSYESALEYTPATNEEKARHSILDGLSKLGNTMFKARRIQTRLTRPWFIPTSQLNQLRRAAVEQHEAQRVRVWQRPERASAAQPLAQYPETSLSFLANVYNEKARHFYHKHGVELIAAAYEAHEEAGEVPVMITKHCLRFSFNLCPKQAKGVQGVQGQVKAEPMTLVSGSEKYTLKFDCKPCEMHIMGTMKKHVLQAPPPSSVEYSPIRFMPKKSLPQKA